MNQRNWISSAPNWAEIFTKHPELEAPGYLETCQAIEEHKNEAEAERVRALMQAINKERVSTRNKNRSASKRSKSKGI